MRKIRILLLLLLAACTSISTEPSTVRGVARDAQGSPIPGVTVTLGTQTTVTDANGKYEFRNVPPGTYDVHFALMGFNIPTYRVAVKAKKDVRLDGRLSPASVAESITVTAAAPVPYPMKTAAISGIAGGVIGGADSIEPKPNYAHLE